jgi:hypothetical protein
VGFFCEVLDPINTPHLAGVTTPELMEAWKYVNFSNGCAGVNFFRETDVGKSKRQSLHVELIFGVLVKFVDYFGWSYGEMKKMERPNVGEESNGANASLNFDNSALTASASVPAFATTEIQFPSSLETGEELKTTRSETPETPNRMAASSPNRRRKQGRSMRLDKMWDEGGGTGPTGLTFSAPSTPILFQEGGPALRPLLQVTRIPEFSENDSDSQSERKSSGGAGVSSSTSPPSYSKAGRIVEDTSDGLPSSYESLSDEDSSNANSERTTENSGNSELNSSGGATLSSEKSNGSGGMKPRSPRLPGTTGTPGTGTPGTGTPGTGTPSTPSPSRKASRAGNTGRKASRTKSPRVGRAQLDKGRDTTRMLNVAIEDINSFLFNFTGM